MQDIKYKDNLIEKIGGQSQYDFVVIDYCENIKDDPSLEHFFGQFQLRDLIKLQKHFLDAVFLDIPPEEAAALKGELIHKYYRLLHMGMNEYYFERLEGHFLEALRESWAEDALVEQFKKCFEELRPLFERSGKAPIQEHHHGLELVFDKEFGPHSASA